jgi:hypothetical protein
MESKCKGKGREINKRKDMKGKGKRRGTWNEKTR